ncbi:putative odorant receptor 85d [Onthophagus taurus]|uniref:putative odorant receptor 85d n=1 Tax=Onthophagus taurus TaxID=166361 RepID=UPI000C209060|nr:putative odorant receptor 85d [Onthophagus taurus]
MDIQDIFSFGLGIQVILSILTLVFIGYVLETEDNDIPKTIKLCLYISVLSIQAAIYGVYGSVLEHNYETVAEAIYDSEWYFGDKSFQQGMQFILRMAQKPAKLTAMGLTDINNTSIIMIYKTIFSILTLIKQLVNTDN